MALNSPIGVFDSGIGGLTVLNEIKKKLPGYDYIYLGDNARTPYGGRSYEVVYDFTLQAVKQLFEMGCELVILACNTASAKALRSIQQNDLPQLAPNKRVLGVIRPSTEIIGTFTSSKHVGILGTEGTIRSGTYSIEIKKFFPDVSVVQQSCPMWVPLIENDLHITEPGRAFIKQNVEELLEKSPSTDVLLLACTHYPLVEAAVQQFVPENVKVIVQGELVANSLSDYLKRHPEMEGKLSKGGNTKYFTTENSQNFIEKARIFTSESIVCQQLTLA